MFPIPFPLCIYDDTMTLTGIDLEHAQCTVVPAHGIGRCDR